MKTRHPSRPLQRLAPFEPMENCESDKVIRQGIITVALNEVLNVCLVPIVKASLHPKKNTGKDRKRKDVSTLEEPTFVDFILTDMAAHAEIKEYLKCSSNVSPCEPSHNAPYKSIVCIQRPQNTSQIQ